MWLPTGLSVCQAWFGEATDLGWQRLSLGDWIVYEGFASQAEESNLEIRFSCVETNVLQRFLRFSSFSNFHSPLSICLSSLLSVYLLDISYAPFWVVSGRDMNPCNVQEMISVFWAAAPGGKADQANRRKSFFLSLTPYFPPKKCKSGVKKTLPP